MSFGHRPAIMKRASSGNRPRARVVAFPAIRQAATFTWYMAISALNRPQTPPGIDAGQWIMAACAVVLLVALAPSWLMFPGAWRESRGHGFFAAAIAAGVFWRERRSLLLQLAPIPGALFAVGGASLLWFAAMLMSARALHLSLLPMLAAGWVLAVCGKSSFHRLLPAWLALLLALPVWEVLVPVLQWLTVLSNQLLLAVVKLNAVIRDYSIVLPSGTLVVADSCSGLNFLLSALTIALAYAAFLQVEWRKRMAVLVLAALLSIVANWVRVFGLVVIADATKMKSPIIKDHGLYGWLIFAAAMVLLFVVAERINRRPDSTNARSNAIDGGDEHPAPADRTARSARMAVAALAIGGTGPLLLASDAILPRRGTVSELTEGVRGASQFSVGIPRSRGDWSPHMTGAAEHLTVRLKAGSEVADVDRFRFSRQSQGREMIGGTNVIAPDSQRFKERMVGPLDSSLRMVREVAVRDNGTLWLVWYWYSVAGVETPSAPKAKLLEVLAFFRRSPFAETTVVTTQCSASDCQEASRLLFRLVAGAQPPAGEP